MIQTRRAIVKKSHPGIYATAAVFALMIAYTCSNVGLVNTEELIPQTIGQIAP